MASGYESSVPFASERANFFEVKNDCDLQHYCPLRGRNNQHGEPQITQAERNRISLLLRDKKMYSPADTIGAQQAKDVLLLYRAIASGGGDFAKRFFSITGWTAGSIAQLVEMTCAGAEFSKHLPADDPVRSILIQSATNKNEGDTFNVPLCSTELPLRIVNRLETKNIHTLGDLRKTTWAVLMSLPGFGDGSREKVIEILNTHDLYEHSPLQQSDT